MAIYLKYLESKLMAIYAKLRFTVRLYCFQIQAVLATLFIICGVISLYYWYRIPNLSINYSIKTMGSVGEPTYGLEAIMNYGNEKSDNDSTAFITEINHPFKDHAPYLFRDNQNGKLGARTDAHFEEYKPLCYIAPQLIPYQHFIKVA